MSTSGTYEYEFEELTPIKGVQLYAHGRATLEWEYEPGDPSVCYGAGYGYDVDDIYLNGDKPGEGLHLDKKSELYKQIVDRLHSRDYVDSIINELEEHNAW